LWPCLNLKSLLTSLCQREEPSGKSKPRESQHDVGAPNDVHGHFIEPTELDVVRDTNLAGNISNKKYPDIVVGNKKGVFVFEHQASTVSHEEWEKVQPKPVNP